MSKHITENQIVEMSKDAESGMPIEELCRKHDIGNSTFYKWQAKCSSMEISDAHRLSTLKLAVIVATKNRSELLATRSLVSIKNQTKTPDFLLVCDDSETSSIKINQTVVNQLQISNCEISYLKNNRTPGASGCWNSAIAFLLTKVHYPEQVFVAFLDDDDEWQPNYIEKCFNTVQNYNLDMVACGINRIEDDSDISYQNFAPDILSVSSFLVGNPGIQGSNLFLRLSTFLQAGCFDESLVSSTDRDLCIRLAELNVVRYQAIHQLLVHHYAESNRARLSTFRSKEKLSGLTAFWLKYQSRMSEQQKIAFSQRAQELFGWRASKSVTCTLQTSNANIAIIFVICSRITESLLEKLIGMFQYFCKYDLVGLDIVFHAEDNDPIHQKFSEMLRNLGIGCFSVQTKSWLQKYSTHVAALRTGSEIHYIENLSHVYFENFQDTKSYLLSCVVTALPDQTSDHINVLAIKEHIYQERVISAKHRITHNFEVNNLNVLGSGSEAIVLTDGHTVYKCIDYWKTRTPEAQFEFLRNNGCTWKNIRGLYPLQTVIRDGVWVIITYPFEESNAYQGGNEERLVQLINSCTRVGIVCNNIHPQNLITTANEVKLIDYGSDIRPWNELGFEHMARRAYLSCWYANRKDLKDLMRQSLTDHNLPELKGFEQFRAKLDYPINKPTFSSTHIETAPNHLPFELVIGVISADPIMLMPLLNSLRVLQGHSSIKSLSVIVLCNGYDPSESSSLFKSTTETWLNIKVISEKMQRDDSKAGYFGANIQNRPEGQVGIAIARTMLQRYVSIQLTNSSSSIGWILDDDMRLDKRACEYIGWLPAFRKQGVDVILGAYEGASPNPPLNGLRVQLMDLVHNLTWLSELPEQMILPNRANENQLVREKFSDYYYDLSRKHTAHLESPIWLEPSYPFETVKEARVRLISGALGILNGTPLTRSIIAPKCINPLIEAKDSVNRGGCTFILNHDAVFRTPNLIPTFNEKEARRSDMIWAIINRYYRGMTIKSVAFPIYHAGRSSAYPTLNADKVKGEIVGSALYAGLTDFLNANPEHRLHFTTAEKEQVYQKYIEHMTSRMLSLKQSFYRINGLAKALTNSHFSSELIPLSSCIKAEFSMTAYEDIESTIKNLSQHDVFDFLDQIIKSTDAYSDAIEDF